MLPNLKDSSRSNVTLAIWRNRVSILISILSNIAFNKIPEALYYVHIHLFTKKKTLSRSYLWICTAKMIFLSLTIESMTSLLSRDYSVTELECRSQHIFFKLYLFLLSFRRGILWIIIRLLFSNTFILQRWHMLVSFGRN